MKKLIILLQRKKLIILNSNEKGRKAIINVQGEEDFPWDETTYEQSFMIYVEEVLNILNAENLKDYELDVIYSIKDADILRYFIKMLPVCKLLQVFTINRILPDILLKSNKIKLGENSRLTYDDVQFDITFTKSGEIHIKEELDIKVHNKLENMDILGFYQNNYNFVTNQTELDEASEKINNLSEELVTEKNGAKIMRKRFIELNKKYNELESQLGTYKTKLSTELNKTKYTSKRVFCYADVLDMSLWNKNNTLAWSLILLSGKFIELDIIRSNGSIVNKGDEIFGYIANYNGEKIPSVTKYLAPISGRIYYLMKDRDRVVKGDVIAVIADPADKYQDVIEWIKNI